MADGTGQIVILNGVQRSGKTSIAQVIQKTFPGIWMNVGVDAHIKCTPPAFRPGVGLRPQRPEWATVVPGRVPLEVLEEYVPVLYAALYESVAAHARLGLNVVMDVVTMTPIHNPCASSPTVSGAWPAFRSYSSASAAQSTCCGRAAKRHGAKCGTRSMTVCGTLCTSVSRRSTRRVATILRLTHPC